MRRFIASALALSAIAFLSSCSPTSSPLQPSATDTGSVSLNVSFTKPNAAMGLSKAPASDFTTGTLTLTKGATAITQPLTIAGGHALAVISNLESGVWSVSVKFYNATANLTFQGNSTVVVQNGKTTVVSVTVTSTGGTVTLDFELPLDSAPPVLWNRMEGVASDVGLSLIPYGTPTYSASLYGNGLDCSANTGYLDIPAAALLLEKGTVEFWFTPNWSSAQDTSRHELICSVNNPNGLRIVYYDEVNAYFSIWNNNCPVDRTFMPLTSGTPAHFALVWDRNGIAGSSDIARLYLNGALVGSNSQVIFPTSINEDVRIGTDGTSHSMGVFDNLKVYDFAKLDFGDRFVE